MHSNCYDLFVPYKDPEKQKAAQNASCKRRREQINKTVQARRAVLRAFVDQLKLKQACEDCGQVYPRIVMDFHHVRGEKLFEIGQSVNLRKTEQAILDEIAKCVLLCANCHRIRHWNEQESRKQLQVA